MSTYFRFSSFFVLGLEGYVSKYMKSISLNNEEEQFSASTFTDEKGTLSLITVKEIADDSMCSYKTNEVKYGE